MTAGPTYSEYHYDRAAPDHAHAYLWPIVEKIVKRLGSRTIIDVGCGAGAITRRLADLADVLGVDASTSGVAVARAAHPKIRFEAASVYDDLAERYGLFEAVVSLEVIEHLYDPRAFARTIFALTQPNGHVVISTPYHGYLKNLALAASGRMDAHFTALWDGGHIKFWSVHTLSRLLRETGFMNLEFYFAGRVKWLAKSMIVTAQRPA